MKNTGMNHSTKGRRESDAASIVVALVLCAVMLAIVFALG